MPKKLNLTVEQKAERYASTHKKSVNLTVQEKADKYDEISRKNTEYCLKWVSKNKEKISITASQHYEKNKIQYNINSCIRLKKKYVSKKAVPESTEL